MFKREHHLRIATVLQSLNSEFLSSIECYFGGGTAIVLTHGEYRESIDIDFLISNLKGYRELRHMITGSESLQPIGMKGRPLKTVGDIRSDQYGIRTMLKVGEAEIKFEIVFEGRIKLQTSENKICGVSTLSKLDMATSKLLAISDRWADDSTFSRDLIDLAMLDLSGPEKREAIGKAKAAYGESIDRDLKRAIETLKSRSGRLGSCLSSLKMDAVPEALVWEKVRILLK